MFRFERTVRFNEVDAARIVFFARFLDYCHDALEELFGALPGGYARLTMTDDVGIPSVRVEVEYKSPLQYGDVAVIEVSVESIGTKSVTFRHVIRRKSDGVECASVRQVVVTARLSRLGAVPVPPAVRALLEAHHAPAVSAPAAI